MTTTITVIKMGNIYIFLIKRWRRILSCCSEPLIVGSAAENRVVFFNGVKKRGIKTVSEFFACFAYSNGDETGEKNKTCRR